MNTRKQVFAMTALMMVTLIIIGIYGAWLPSRETDAAVDFEEKTAGRGSILFARNCRLCHGDVAEGGSLGGRLPAAAPLDRSSLQGFVDSKTTLDGSLDAGSAEVLVKDGSRFSEGKTILISTERMEVRDVDGNTLRVKRATGHTEELNHFDDATILILDAQTLTETQTLITNTITCGRVGTAMPAWAQSQGGPISDEQIRQLMVLITTGRWDLVKEEADLEDTTGFTIAEGGISAESTLIGAPDVLAFSEGEALRIGAERLRVIDVPAVDRGTGDKSGFIEVERGVLGTASLAHDEGTVVYRFPEISEPSINQASCGQTARASAPVGTPGLIEDFEGQEVEIAAFNIAFDTDEITVSVGGDVRIRFDHQDTGVEHNVAVYASATDLTPVSDGSVGVLFPGPEVDDTVFEIPEAGTYFFRCDVHPTLMTGTFTVTP